MDVPDGAREKPADNNPQYFGGPMVPVNAKHDTGTKTILGQSIPAGQSAQQDLTAALGIIFNHPNVGPFVATQLIEKLVTSNPSPLTCSELARHSIQEHLTATVPESVGICRPLSLRF